MVKAKDTVMNKNKVNDKDIVKDNVKPQLMSKSI